MRHHVLSAATFAFVLSAVACGGSEPPPAAPSTPTSTSTTSTTTETSTTPATPAPSTPAPATGAKEGEACGDGVMGRPAIPCAAGLTCDLAGTAPAAPPGAQGSARPGRCKKM